MTPLHVEVVILGAGTAGMGANRAAHAHVDSVLLIAAAEAAHQAGHAQAFGIQVPAVTVDGYAVMARVQRERGA